MRILALVTDSYAGYGGMAQYNRDLLDGLCAMPAVEEIHLLSRCGPTSLQPPPKLRQEPARPGRLAYARRATAVALAGGRYDAVFCGHLFHAPLAAYVAALLRAPMWLQLHGIDAWRRPGAMIVRAAQRAELVTAVSRYTRRRFLQWADLPHDRVKVLPNTFDPRFNPGAPDSEFLARHGLHGKRLLASVTRLNRADAYKGVDRLIEAMPELLPRQPELEYFIAGDGDDRSRLEQLARKLGVEQRVRFLGRISDEDLVSLYRAADVFALPSTKEGFGIVFVQAAACGARVVAADAGGSVDALAEGSIGALVNPHDTPALIEALASALSSDRGPPAQVQRFGQQNFRQHLEAMVGLIGEGR